MTILEFLATTARAGIVTSNVAQRVDVWLRHFVLVFVRPWPVRQRSDHVVERRDLLGEQPLLANRVPAGEEIRKFRYGQPLLGDQTLVHQFRRLVSELLVAKDGGDDNQIIPNVICLARPHLARQLAQIIAKLRLGIQTVAGQPRQREQSLAAQADLDTAEATATMAHAGVDMQQASLQQAAASLHQAQVNLSYTSIVSPIDGQVGLRMVDAGNYVQTSSTSGLVVIAQMQPISVLFSVPEDNLPDIIQRVRAGATLTVEAYDRANARLLATGQLATLDNQIDTTTGTLKLRALFANPDELLYPNQFVNARLLVNTMQNTTRVPVPAVQRGEPGTYVYVINANNTVSVRPVKLGPTDGGYTAVVSGLQPGEKVVTDGTDRLRDGALVTVPPPGQSRGQNQGQNQGQGRGQARGAPDQAAPTGQPGQAPPAQTTPPGQAPANAPKDSP